MIDSTKAIDRLFDRLGNIYGARWDALWMGRPMREVKTAWLAELDSLMTTPDGLSAIAFALEHLPGHPPSAPEIRALARQAPRSEVYKPELPAPANPERLAAELSRLADLKKDFKHSDHDSRAWARQILDLEERGVKRHTQTVLLFAKQALKLVQKEMT